MAPPKSEVLQIDPQIVTQGILVMLVAQREDTLNEKDRRPTEVLLSDAGLNISQIAAVMGREYEAVKSAIRRERQKERKRQSGGEVKRPEA